jgi:HD-like signal output (HDOD) protein
MNLSIDRHIEALPPMPRSLVLVEDICQRGDVDMSELADAISSDPMLTANIIKSANSPFYGFSGEITSIKHAVTLLGANMIRGFAIAQTMRRTFGVDLSPYGLTEDGFLALTESQRALAFHWTAAEPGEIQSILSPAAFMMEVGKIVVAQELLRSGRDRDFKAAWQRDGDILQAELDHVGRSSAEVAARIFTRWRFETKIIRSIRFMDEPDYALDEVADHAWRLHVIGLCLSVRERLAKRDVAAASRVVKERRLGEKAFHRALKIVQKSNKAVLA